MIDMQARNRQMIEAFRATRAEKGIPLDGRPMLLLTTTGAKSGQPHITPLMAVTMHGRLFVIASNVGAPVHPDWYRNLIAHPVVQVEHGAETYMATAMPAQGAKREALWATLIAKHPFFADHQTKTAREIPIVELRRKG
jgi:deazaflavin-dependent oxidoreductase (nitroreductase family)